MKKSFLAAALAALLALPAWAQPKAPGTDYPNKPVRVIVAFAAGGNADINARLISTALSQQLGQQFVVENRPSGGGTVAFETIAQTPPDGYTLLVGALGSHTLNVGLYGDRLRIHPLTGVDHITISSHSPIVLATHPSMNVRTLAEFRAAVAAGGGQVLYGSSGNGSTGHISSALLLHLLGVPATHVPYRGSAAAFQDLMAGRISFQSDTISFLAEHIKNGTVNGIVIGTPLPIRQFLYEQIAIALRKPEVRDRLIQLGNTIPDGMTPEATRAFIAAELDKWVPIVRATGARVD